MFLITNQYYLCFTSRSFTRITTPASGPPLHSLLLPHLKRESEGDISFTPTPATPLPPPSLETRVGGGHFLHSNPCHSTTPSLAQNVSWRGGISSILTSATPLPPPSLETQDFCCYSGADNVCWWWHRRKQWFCHRLGQKFYLLVICYCTTTTTTTTTTICFHFLIRMIWFYI